MVRLADPAALHAHLARFDLEHLPREGLRPVDVRRLDVLLRRRYEDLRSWDVAHALDLAARAGPRSPWFAYFLPAALRAPPVRNLSAGEAFLTGLLQGAGDAASAAWDTEIEDMLEEWLRRRPLRGGDDPVELWITDEALRLRWIEAGRRVPGAPRLVPGGPGGWRVARDGPLYPRASLLLLARFPDRAVARLEAWEGAAQDAAARAWVEVLFHAHGMGWRAPGVGLERWLEAPQRLERARALVDHPDADVALGAVGVMKLMRPGPDAALAPRVEARVREADASESDRFVLLPAVRRLLEVG